MNVGKRFEKSNETIVFNVLYIKKEIKYIQLIFQKLIEIAKKTNNFLKDTSKRKRK